MARFDGIVGVLLGDVAGGGQPLVKHAGVGRCPVGGDLTRVSAVLEGVGEEPPRGRQIRLSETSTSMTWPYWSIARYR
jgi:hypothetical protein